MMYIALIMVFLFAAFIFRNYCWKLIRAKWYGIETDALVARIEKQVRKAQGADYPVCYYYVHFQESDGKQNEARLLNPGRLIAAGSRIRVKYLPEEDDFAVLTEILEI